MAKGLKLKVRKFWGLLSAFVVVTEEKLVRMTFLSLPHTHPTLIRVKELKKKFFSRMTLHVSLSIDL